jgi:hypothetical protein
MLSKGQGTTMATYAQLIRALDMDHRAKEAHEFWLKKIGRDLHSVPWKLCNSMISIYYRNNMLENLIKVWFAACHMLLDMENWLCNELIMFTRQSSSRFAYRTFFIVL